MVNKPPTGVREDGSLEPDTMVEISQEPRVLAYNHMRAQRMLRSWTVWSCVQIKGHPLYYPHASFRTRASAEAEMRRIGSTK